MQIFLSGPMGSGKSTVGKLLGKLAGCAFVDLDERIAQLAGASISEIFRSQGEAAFRKLEQATLRELLASQGPAVIALGGGAVTDPALRRVLLTRGFLVTLEAPSELLAQRVGERGQGRPLLEGADVVARLNELRAQRAAAYAECHLRLDTAALTPEAVAQRVWQAAQAPDVLVPLADGTYRVQIGSGVRTQLLQCIADLRDVSAVMFVTDSVVHPLWCRALADAVAATGLRVTTQLLEPGEVAKTLASVETLWHAALDAGLDRKSLLVGVGGGVVGDLSGFAAATLLRGVRVGHIPTTLLAMVDSSVGGKTGFDTRHGKNLVGAFHQPSFVLADVETLSSLPDAERCAGLAEVAKSAWIDSEASVAELERDAAALRAGDPAATTRAIRMSVRLKARIVTEDEREAGSRALLNLGHTLGHAIEASLGYHGMRHGEAVALGMIAAFQVSQRLGRIEHSTAARAQQLLAALGLPTSIEPYLHQRVFEFLVSDKKRTGTTLSYVLPELPGQVGITKLQVAELVRLLVG